MFSFHTIGTRFKINAFNVYQFGGWMLLQFLYFCFLCVQSCSISRLFPLWFFDSKYKLCQYGIWLQTNSLSFHWFYEAITFKMLTTDIRVFVYWSVLPAIVPTNSCLIAAVNAMISPCIPLWNFSFDTQELCNASPWRKKLKIQENIMYIPNYLLISLSTSL